MKLHLIPLISALLAIALLASGCADSRQEDSLPETTISVQERPTVSQTEPETSMEPENSETNPIEEENSEMKMIISVSGQEFTASLEHNSAVDKLIQILEQGPVTLHLRDYAGFEKVGPLGQSLPTSNYQITTQPGDIVLYQGNQIVMFYGTNSWSYTMLGHIDHLDGWQDALGSGDVEVTLELP